MGNKLPTLLGSKRRSAGSANGCAGSVLCCSRSPTPRLSRIAGRRSFSAFASVVAGWALGPRRCVGCAGGCGEGTASSRSSSPAACRPFAARRALGERQVTKRQFVRACREIADSAARCRKETRKRSKGQWIKAGGAGQAHSESRCSCSGSRARTSSGTRSAGTWTGRRKHRRAACAGRWHHWWHGD